LLLALRLDVVEPGDDAFEWVVDPLDRRLPLGDHLAFHDHHHLEEQLLLRLEVVVEETGCHAGFASNVLQRGRAVALATEDGGSSMDDLAASSGVVDIGAGTLERGSGRQRADHHDVSFNLG
jgi:hypothetical protein